MLGLDETEIGRDARQEMGAPLPGRGAAYQQYEPVDPARIQPKWLVVTALGLAVILFGGYALWRHYQARTEIIAEDAQPAATNVVAATNPQPTDAPASINAASASNAALPASQAAATTGTVALTATRPVWVRIYDADDKVLYQQDMKVGDSFTVPSNANKPQIRTGAPDALSVTIDGKPVAPLGSGRHMIKNVEVDATALRARPAPATPVEAAQAPAQ